LETTTREIRYERIDSTGLLRVSVRAAELMAVIVVPEGTPEATNGRPTVKAPTFTTL
jgi:hypothetical protein